MAIGILGQYHWHPVVFCQAATTTVLLENSSNIYPAVFDFERCVLATTIVALCPNVLRCQIYSRVSEMRGVTGSADFAPEPSTSHLPPSPAFHVPPSLPRHPRFSFLPAARCSQQYPDPGKQLWQSLNVRRDKIWRHTKCDDSMGNSMKYDSWQLTDK